ncbi:MAG: hypothetical protein ACN2B6_00910, partial [Rickettsiales bacterium]
AIKTEGDYSIKILDKNSVQVYYSPNSNVSEALLNTLQTVDTLAELKAFDTSTGKVAYQGVTYEFTSGDYSTEVAADGVGYYIESDDVVATSGAWVAQAKVIHPSMFGADVNATDNSEALQKCFDVSPLADVLVSFDETYETQYPVYIPAGFNYVGKGKIRNTNTTNANEQLCIKPGNYHPAYFDDLTYYDCNSAQAGAVLVTTTASDAANFPAGTNVFIRSEEYYDGNNSAELPLYSSLNRVISSDSGTGEIVFEYPILANITNPQVGLADNNIPDVLNDRTLYVCYKSKIYGLSLESVEGNCLERGGFLGCDFNFQSMTSLTGVFTNAACFSTVRVNLIDCDRKPFDVAGGSIGSKIEVNTVNYKKTARSSNSVLVAINENARNVTVEVNSFVADGFDYAARAIAQFGSANNCVINIEHLTSYDSAGVIVQFSNVLRSDPGETQNATTGNNARIGRFKGGTSLQRFVNFIDDGGLCDNNTVDGVFRGTPTVEAVDLTGDGNKVLGYYESGVVDISGATNYEIDVKAPDGVDGYSRTDSGTIRLNGQDYDEKPNIVSHSVSSRGAPNNTTPDMLEHGSFQVVTYTNNASFTVNNPTNAKQGDELNLVLVADNLSATLTPTFGSAYDTSSETLVGIAVGNASYFRFVAAEDDRFVLVGASQNYTP